MEIIFSAQHSLPFHGHTDRDRGMGGSEYALLVMAKCLAALDHQVKVYNRCGGSAGVYDGVEYIDFFTQDPYDQPADIMVVFREANYAARPARARKKVLWVHDDYSKFWQDPLKIQEYSASFNHPSLDRVFCISRWQGSVFKHVFGLQDDKIYYTRNGVDMALLASIPEVPKRNQLVYHSMPNRGLDVLLKLFPRLRREVPDLTLTVCGLSLEDARENGFFLEGVSYLGALSKPQLFTQLQRSKLYVYPNHFAVPYGIGYFGVHAECSCMACLEAQACAAPIVTSRQGALVESVRDMETGILIDGDPYSESYQKLMIDHTIRLLTDEVIYQQFSQAARGFIRQSYAWDQIAREWQEAFEALLAP